ncbi:MAG: GFA family protein [Marinicellaceae bacterium]
MIRNGKWDGSKYSFKIIKRLIMVKGQCNCHAIAFEIKADISDVYVCHCSICRRSTGVNGIAVCVVDNQQFKWIKGKDLIRTWHKPDHDWQTSFCQICGSTLPGVNDNQRMYVPVGLITKGGENLKVAHHIWVDSKASWDKICDEGTQHSKQFVNNNSSNAK